MTRLLASSALLFILSLLVSPSILAASGPAQKRLDFIEIPLSFEPLRSGSGWWARGQVYAVKADKSGLAFSVPQPDGGHQQLQLYALNAQLSEPVAEELQASYSNYFVGNDPANWRSLVPHYGRLRYREVYPGIDLVVYGNRGRVEYDFVVTPGADPSQIALAVQGASLHLESDGGIRFDVGDSKLRQERPNLYQDSPEHSVPGGYRIDGSVIRFEIGQYDRSKTLVIDPIIVFAALLGGQTGDDRVNAIAVDNNGNLYVTGRTQSIDFPTASPIFPMTDDADDAFISKLSADGSSLIYSTYIGGDGLDMGTSIAVDAGGRPYMGGLSSATDYPVSLNNALDTTLGAASDGVLTVLNAAGSAIDYSTYLGGSDDFVNQGVEGVSGVDVDSNGLAYLGGTTDAGNFPVTMGAFRENASRNQANSSDCFITVLDPSQSGGASLIYSTYLGSTTASETCEDLTHYGGNAAAIVGESFGPGYPTTANAFAATHDTFGDVVVTVLDTTQVGANQLLYSTYLGGDNSDFARSVAVDAGDVLVAGSTISSDFPTTAGVFQPGKDLGFDAFAARISPSLAGAASLLWSTHFGGDGDDSAFGIDVNAAGEAMFVGSTLSTDLPATPGALSFSYAGGEIWGDMFLTHLNNNATALQYMTYLGTANDDAAFDIAIDGDRTNLGGLAVFPLGIDLVNREFGFIAQIAPAADLTLNLFANPPEQVIAGEPLSFIGTVTNLGPDVATNSTFSMPIPSDTVFESASITFPPPNFATADALIATPRTPSPCQVVNGVLNCDLGDLGSGIQAIVTVNLTVSSDAVGTDSDGILFIIGTASVASDLFDQDTGNNSDFFFVELLFSADLAVTKSGAPNPAIAGEELTYTIVVQNLGPSDSRDLVITDSLPLSMASFVSVTGQASNCTLMNGTLQCQLQTLPAGQMEQVEVVIRLNPDAIFDGDTIFNQASVSAMTPDPDSNNDVGAESLPVIQVADIQLTKTDIADPVAPLEMVTYTLTVANLGPSDNAGGLVVQDTLPEQSEFISASPDCSLDGDVYCFVDGLAAGQMAVFSITVQPAIIDGILTNTATVSQGVNDPNPDNNTDVESTTIAGAADLVAAMTSTSPQLPLGGTAVYTAIVSNQGPAEAMNVQLLVRTSPDLTFDSSQIDLGGSCSSTVGLQTCNLGNVPVGTSRTVLFQITPTSPGVLLAIASVGSDSFDPVPSNNSARAFSVVLPTNDLAITKTGFDTAVAGRPFRFDLEVANAGVTPTPASVLTDTLPTAFEFVDAVASEAVSCMHAAGTLTCQIPELAGGAVASIQVNVLVAAEARGIVTNQASVLGPFADTDQTNNTASLDVNIVQRGDLNGDGVVDASDIVLLILEVYDGDGENVDDVAGGTNLGNFAYDIDEDGLVTISDYRVLTHLAVGRDPDAKTSP